jgi:hypothetical protein
LTEVVLKRIGNRRENFMTVVFFYLSRFPGVELINTMNRGGYKYTSLSFQKSAGLQVCIIPIYFSVSAWFRAR